MSKVKILIGLALATTALVAATAPASANFFGMKAAKCASATLNVCGTNLTSITFEPTAGVLIKCFSEGVLFERWTIQKAEASQEEVREGGHLEIELSCEGTSSGKVNEIKLEGAAKLAPGCAIQLEQKAGQTKEVRGKVTKACTIKVNECTITIPTLFNQGFGFVTLADTEKGASLMEMLVKAGITGLTTTATSTTCGYKESKTGDLEGEFDIWDVLWT